MSRFETKFSISNLAFDKIRYIIKTHPAIFNEIYYKRHVNNIYFDNLDFSSFKDNIEGVSERKKVRIRWYGDLFGLCKNPVLEIKYKKGFLGWKEKHLLPDFNLNLNKGFNYEKIFFNLLKKKNYDLHKLKLQFLKPSLLNRYERIYYLSFNKKYRITLDNNMEFFSINPINNHIKTFSDYEKNIVELKYDENYRDDAVKITNYLPFRMTKSSKYVIGLDRIGNWQ